MTKVRRLTKVGLRNLRGENTQSLLLLLSLSLRFVGSSGEGAPAARGLRGRAYPQITFGTFEPTCGA
jgi:hypothetical protein